MAELEGKKAGEVIEVPIDCGRYMDRATSPW